MTEVVDVAVVGAGAAGLMAAIQAGRVCKTSGASRRIAVFDGARKLGAKILIAGGGRCNVTHYAVDEEAFAGSSPHSIRKVLLRFDVPETITFFQELGVDLKREDTGKLFPVTDDAHTVLEALLRATREAQVGLRHPWRVTAIERDREGYLLRRDGSPGDADPTGPGEPLRARRVILATGGRSIPKSGSDGVGYDLVRSLGHSVTPQLLPGLVPLTLPRQHFLCALSGVAFPARLDLRAGSGKRLRREQGPVLCAHFGLTGPAILDMSRYYLHARLDDPEVTLSMNLLPDSDGAGIDGDLQRLGAASVLSYLRRRLPERVAAAVIEAARTEPARPGAQLDREARRRLVRMLTDCPLPVTGSRGFNFAEVTAGGVPLTEVRLETLESRLCPGLHLCGEILDVDGRIGGYNFQWAWASGTVAGIGAVAGLEAAS